MTLKSIFENVINYDLTSEKSLSMFGFIAIFIILSLIKYKYNSKIRITPLLAGGTVVLNAVSFGYFRDFAKLSLVNCFMISLLIAIGSACLIGLAINKRQNQDKLQRKKK